MQKNRPIAVLAGVLSEADKSAIERALNQIDRSGDLFCMEGSYEAQPDDTPFFFHEVRKIEINTPTTELLRLLKGELLNDGSTKIAHLLK